MDAALARCAREAGQLRFEMGRGLDRLERSGGDHALGFSSIEAYALERCERSASWAQKARGLARRLEGLPLVAKALISGSTHWTMAALLASVARADDAHFWLEQASRRTVREMKALVLEHQGPGASARCDAQHLEVEEETRTLTLTVPREDAWCFEQAKLLARHLADSAHATDADVMFALVAESTSTLCGTLPHSAIEPADDDATNAQRAWEQELARMRAEAEERCEANFRPGAEHVSEAELLTWPDSPEAIDGQLRAVAQRLVLHELDYGRALEAFFLADGWRRLGYATAAQYARERLGGSLSSIKSKRHLAKRLRGLKRLAEAVERGDLGYEAARLVAAVATNETEAAWVERAQGRTLRHLREEIDIAALRARWSESAAVVPPSDDEVLEVEALERAVVMGQISVPLGTALPVLPGKITLRLRVRASTARDFRHWETLYLRHRGSALRHTTFLRFASELFASTWRPRPDDVAYSRIYERDRYRCQSPCCSRRDVTPHHLRLRSRGGDDSDENLTSLCTWCHMEGVHGGQMSAAPPASRIRWTFGRKVHTVVDGRRRIRG